MPRAPGVFKLPNEVILIQSPRKILKHADFQNCKNTVRVLYPNHFVRLHHSQSAVHHGNVTQHMCSVCEIRRTKYAVFAIYISPNSLFYNLYIPSPGFDWDGEGVGVPIIIPWKQHRCAALIPYLDSFVFHPSPLSPCCSMNRHKHQDTAVIDPTSNSSKELAPTDPPTYHPSEDH